MRSIANSRPVGPETSYALTIKPDQSNQANRIWNCTTASVFRLRTQYYRLGDFASTVDTVRVFLLLVIAIAPSTKAHAKA